MKPELDTNMYLVKKKHEYEVIKLSTIERSIYLILNFGKKIRSRQKAKLIVDQRFESI